MRLSVLGSFKFVLLLMVCVLAVQQVASQDDEEEGSSRSRSCRVGACIRLRQCGPFVRLIRHKPFLARRVIRRSICGRTFGEPQVCCPGVENDDDDSSSSSSENNSNNNANEENNNEENNNEENNNEEIKNEENNTTSPNKAQPLRPPQCGFSNKLHNRVVGGSPAEVGAWPWIANLGFNTDDPNDVVFICGASLISSRHVLTAGHCVYKVRDFFVRLGEYDLSSDDDGAHPIDIPVEKITLHPRYNHDLLENDIAILKLAKEVEFTDDIHPICLPVDDSIKNRNLVNYYPFVAGWGKTTNAKDDPGSDILRETQVPVVDQKTCANNYRGIRNVVVNDNVICAGYGQGGKDACQGDSGGPLMLPQKQNYYLIGIVSGGYLCAKPNYPGIYTRVTSFLDFILSNMN